MITQPMWLRLLNLLMLHHLYSTESVEHLTVSLVTEQKEKRQLNVTVHKLGKSFANDGPSRKNDDIMRLYFWILKELLIKFGRVDCFIIYGLLVFVKRLFLCWNHTYLTNVCFFVANGQVSSLYPVMAGVPQGGVWSLLLFNLCVRHLLSQLQSCLLVSYAEDSTQLKVNPTKLSAAAEINVDLCRTAEWGRR